MYVNNTNILLLIDNVYIYSPYINSIKYRAIYIKIIFALYVFFFNYTSNLKQNKFSTHCRETVTLN